MTVKAHQGLNRCASLPSSSESAKALKRGPHIALVYPHVALSAIEYFQENENYQIIPNQEVHGTSSKSVPKTRLVGFLILVPGKTNAYSI